MLTAPALAADRYVWLRGSDAGNDCLFSLSPCASVAAAVAQAASGDSIRVAAGRYHENVTLESTMVLTIEGGWSQDFTTRDPVEKVTTLNGARGVGPVVLVEAGIGVTIALTLDGLTITGGRSDGVVGGGVWANGPAGAAIDLTVRNCIVSRNKGPGISAASGVPGSVDLEVVGSIVRANRGRGIDVAGVVNAVLTDMMLERNRDDGLRVESYGSSTVTLTGCTVRRNASISTFGAVGTGGIFFRSHSGTSNLTIDRLPSRRTGGLASAVRVSVLAGVTALALTNSVFLGNRHTDSGGGVILAAALAGLAPAQLDMEVTGSTVARNGAGGLVLVTGGQVGVDATLTATVRDTILWDNADGVGADLDLDSGGALSVDADHNVIGELRTGTATFNDLGGNLSVDPLLASRIDVHLTAGSPAIDAGTCTGAPPTDFEGDPRPSGLGCDIGADEFVP